MTFSVNAHVGRRLRELRVAKGLTQAELGERLGVTQQAVANYEAGNDRLTAARLYQAAKALGVGVGELFEGIEE